MTFTEELADLRIANVTYYHLPNSTHTLCYITVDNGFVITGESACIYKDGYDEEIGQSIAYERAYTKLLSYLGFLELEKMHESK